MELIINKYILRDDDSGTWIELEEGDTHLTVETDEFILKDATLNKVDYKEGVLTFETAETMQELEVNVIDIIKIDY